MSEKPRDDMERDEKLTALYRMAAQEEPPVHLDDALRAAARRAVASRPRAAHAPAMGWRVSMSIAAVVVLSVSLVTVMREESPELTQPPRADTPESPAQAQRPPSPGPDVGTLAGTPASEAKDAGNVGLKPPSQQPSRPGLGLRSNGQAPVPPTELRKEAPAADRSVESEPARLAGRPPSEPFPRADEARNIAGAAAGKPARPAEEESRARDSQFAEARRPASVSPRGSEKLASAPAAPSGGSSESAPKAEAADSVPREQPRARVLTPAPAQQPASRVAGAARTDANLAPDKWLEQIEALRKQGRSEEARASFANFRRRYPDYPLPDTLKDWTAP